jgi:RimJ/RimL family protein N-acetyltransferase
MSRQALPLITSRLTLRAVQPSDRPFFYQLYADWQVAQYLLRTPSPFTPAHAQAFVDAAMEGLNQGHTYTLVIELRSLDQAIGVITLRIPSRDPSYPEAWREEDQGLGILGYSILPSMWGHRYASESTLRVVTFAFDELQLDRIQASTIKTNTASRRLLERIGFTIVEADILEEPLHGGTPQPGDCYMLYRSQV